jgi:hypothetical protein
MGRRPGYKTEQVLALAERSEGVSSRELQDLLFCEPNTANSLLVRATRLHGLVRTRAGSGKFVYFSTPQHCAAYQAAALAAQQHLAGQYTQARQLAAETKAARKRARAAARVAAQAAANKPKGRALATCAQALVPTEAKRTVYERAPQAHRVDIMADALPGVPGWPGGPVIRPGALDYKRHLAVRGAA